MRPMHALTLPCVAVVLLAAGCGGDDRLSAEDYRAEATKLCTESEKRTDALGQPRREAELEGFLTRGIEITDGYVGQFAELQPPEDLQAKHDAAADAIRAQLGRLEDLRDDIRGGTDPERAFAGAQAAIQRGDSDTDAKFRALDLPECADE